MIVKSRVGDTAIKSDGVDAVLRSGRLGDLIASLLHGKNYETTSRGNTHSAMLAATTGTIAAGNINGAAAAASTQFALWNPLGSGINVSLQRFYCAVISGTAPGGPVNHSFAAGVPNTSVGARANSGLVNVGPPSSALFLASAAGAALTGAPNPLSLLRPSKFNFFAAAIAATTVVNDCVEEIDGDIVLPPGTMWVPTWSAAGTTLLNAYGVTWEEIPI